MKSLKKWLLLIVALIAVDVLGCVLYYKKVQDFVLKQPYDVHADLMVVFQRNVDYETRALGSGTIKRLDRAISLYDQGNIDWILCVGGARPQIKLYGAKLMKNYLVKHGLDGNKVFYDSLSYDTGTNWAEAMKVIRHYQFKDIVAVSSPLHIYRIASIVNNDEHVVYAAYNYEFNTLSNYWFVFYSIHYEWMANVLRAIFPEKVYLKILRFIRQGTLVDWI